LYAFNMHFACPICQRRLEIENDRAGECLLCPACNRQICVPKAPLVIHKGLHNMGGIRLVAKPPEVRKPRKGSLEERVAALKTFQTGIKE